MKNLIIDYGRSGNNYYYEGGQLYTETGELVPEGEAIMLHFKETGRTPLATARFTQLLSKDQFRRFDLFLDQLPDREREYQIRRAIKSIQKRITLLSKTGLSGGEGIDQEIAYEDHLKALEQRLQGNTGKSWKGLYDDLTTWDYITDVSEEDFRHVMNKKKLPEGRVNKVKWTGHFPASRCALFGQEFGFKWKQLNECFDAGISRDVRSGDVPKAYRLEKPEGKPDPQLRTFKAMLEKHKIQ